MQPYVAMIEQHQERYDTHRILNQRHEPLKAAAEWVLSPMHQTTHQWIAYRNGGWPFAHWGPPSEPGLSGDQLMQEQYGVDGNELQK